eukprot:365711-Chlamydomonas_euryale.AAC.15
MPYSSRYWLISAPPHSLQFTAPPTYTHYSLDFSTSSTAIVQCPSHLKHLLCWINVNTQAVRCGARRARGRARVFTRLIKDCRGRRAAVLQGGRPRQV